MQTEKYFCPISKIGNHSHTFHVYLIARICIILCFYADQSDLENKNPNVYQSNGSNEGLPDGTKIFKQNTQKNKNPVKNSRPQ